MSDNPDPVLAPWQIALRALQARLVAHVAAGRTTDMAAQTLRLPAGLYSDPKRLQAEQTELFLKHPLVVGLSGDLPQPGATKLFDGAGPPILLTRQRDGTVAAFLNMCTHRGARLLREPGLVQALTCPFHGWSFDLDGRLIAQPGKDGFEGVDRECLHLLRVPCAERYGLLFVRAQVGGEDIDVDALLGPLIPDLQNLQLDALSLIKEGPLHTAGNWKYVLDTYGEGYHFASLHPDTLAQTHYNNVHGCDFFGPHFRVVFPLKTYAGLAKLPQSQWPGIESVVYVLFPNTAIVVGSPQPGLMVVQVFRIYPNGVKATRVDLSVYAPTAALSEQTRPMFEAGFDLAAHIVQTEDFRVAAEAQANLAYAPAHFQTLLGRNEPALQHLQRGIAAAIGMPLP